MKNVKKVLELCSAISIILLISLLLNACSKKDAIPVKDTIKNLSLDSLQILTSNIPTAMYTDLTFLSNSTAFAIAEGSIIKTTDGGESWISVNCPVTASLKKIQFTDSQTGYIIGNDIDGGFLLKTTDGGNAWSEINVSNVKGITGMFFLNNNTGFLTGENFFIKTTTGGFSWTSLQSDLYRFYNDVNFKNDKDGIVTASDGFYFKTSNGGVSWDSVQTSTAGSLYTIYFADAKILAVKSADTLIDLAGNYAVTKIPANSSKLLFLNSSKCVGIGSHYDQGFWPYGDILVTNNGWIDFNQKTYTQVDAIGFGAIAKMPDGKIMILGTGFSGTKVIILKK